MRQHIWKASCSLLAAAMLAAAPAGAQVLGQVDDFEDGTSQGWFFGGGPLGVTGFPVILPDNGPAGTGDSFMSLSSSGLAGPGGRLTISNAAQWAGNYLATGVGLIAMDVNNAGQTDLDLRLVFETLGVGGPSNIAFSIDPIHVAAGGGWQRIFFSIRPTDLMNHPGLPGSSVLGALMNTTLIRLYHSPAANSPNPFVPIPLVAASLGVDNITALAPIPEPSTVVLLTSGVLALAALRRRATRPR